MTRYRVLFKGLVKNPNPARGSIRSWVVEASDIREASHLVKAVYPGLRYYRIVPESVVKRINNYGVVVEYDPITA